MLVIFPFEEAFYRENGVQAEFVGHPLAELPLPSISRQQFAMDNHLDPASTWIGLLPGSRPKEIRDHLPTMLDAARILTQRPGESEFIVPLAPTLSAQQRAEVLKIVREFGHGLTVRLVDDARDALFHARASVVASGTATVEAALIGNPFVVVYRVSALTYAIARRVVKVPHVAMANLIAGKRLVPELIQNDFTASNIVEQIQLLLPDGAARESMMKELGTIRGRLSLSHAQVRNGTQAAIDRVAAVTLEELGSVSPSAVELAVQP
jgi:lipid-A-disaccharide synthase